MASAKENSRPAGILSPGHAPTLVLTATALTEGSMLILKPAINPPNATQLWTFIDNRIALAANVNLVIGPGVSVKKEAVLFDITKANNASSKELKFSGRSDGDPVIFDNTNFTATNMANGSRPSQAIDVSDKSTSAGASVVFWKRDDDAINQKWTFSVVPPIVPRIVLYDVENFTGTNVEFTTAVADLSAFNFSSKTSSLIVTAGKWLLYNYGSFGGDINNFFVVSSDGGPNGDGRYPDPSAWSEWRAGGNAIISARPLPNTGVVLFESQFFTGRAVEIQSDTADISFSGLKDAISSVIVVTGTWRLFTQTGFTGTSSRVFKNGGLYLSGFYPQQIQWAGTDNQVNSLRIEG